MRARPGIPRFCLSHPRSRPVPDRLPQAPADTAAGGAGPGGRAGAPAPARPRSGSGSRAAARGGSRRRPLLLRPPRRCRWRRPLPPPRRRRRRSTRRTTRSSPSSSTSTRPFDTVSSRRREDPRRQRGLAEAQLGQSPAHRGALRPARHRGVQPGARRAAGQGRDGLPGLQGRVVGPHHHRVLRQGAAPLHRVNRGLLRPEPA